MCHTNTQAKEKDIELLHDAIECRMRELAKKVRSESSSGHGLAPPVATPVTSQASMRLLHQKQQQQPQPQSHPHQQQEQSNNSCNSSSPAPSSPSSSSNSSIHSSASPSASLSSDSVLLKPTTSLTPDKSQLSTESNGPALVGDENGGSGSGSKSADVSGENGVQKPAVLPVDAVDGEAVVAVDPSLDPPAT